MLWFGEYGVWPFFLYGDLLLWCSVPKCYPLRLYRPLYSRWKWDDCKFNSFKLISVPHHFAVPSGGILEPGRIFYGWQKDRHHLYGVRCECPYLIVPGLHLTTFVETIKYRGGAVNELSAKRSGAGGFDSYKGSILIISFIDSTVSISAYNTRNRDR